MQHDYKINPLQIILREVLYSLAKRQFILMKAIKVVQWYKTDINMYFTTIQSWVVSLPF